MKNKKYIVCRDDIYVGEVVRTTGNIYRCEGFRTKPGQLRIASYRSYRSMLFVSNENGLSNDLLYQSPNYPILNIADDGTCLNLDINSIVIKGAYNLAPLLEYFGYKKDLTYEDIMNIRKTFFTADFAHDNCQLFGWRETTINEELTFSGYRIFKYVGDGHLPREYFNILDARGDNTLMAVIKRCDEKMNAFTPHIREGLIKKLSRF